MRISGLFKVCPLFYTKHVYIKHSEYSMWFHLHKFGLESINYEKSFPSFLLFFLFLPSFLSSFRSYMVSIKGVKSENKGDSHL